MERFLTEKVISKTLGVTWNSQQNKFIYSSKSIEPAIKFIKRYVLSEISKIFDPLGFLGLTILLAKTIMQEC